MKARTNNTANRGMYARLILDVFLKNYRPGASRVRFTRKELEAAAMAAGLDPSNIGDVIYSFRYRKELPSEILSKQPAGKAWALIGVGQSVYEFQLKRVTQIIPNALLTVHKIYDSTPEIVKAAAHTDEQALLARIRYSKLLDVMTGVSTHSLQSHYKTTVTGVGQIEIDEVYVGQDKRGRLYVFPMQAKGGKDKLSCVQTIQDITCCKQQFPLHVCRPFAAQFMAENRIAMIELELDNTDEVCIVEERHYILVNRNEYTEDEIRAARSVVED